MPDCRVSLTVVENSYGRKPLSGALSEEPLLVCLSAVVVMLAADGSSWLITRC